MKKEKGWEEGAGEDGGGYGEDGRRRRTTGSSTSLTSYMRPSLGWRMR